MAYRIFLIDDDRFLLDLYAIKFKNDGHDVTAFLNGNECLAALRDKEIVPPNAILIDVIMPGISGFEILETIRNENLAQNCKVIILSNQGQDSDIRKAKELRADGYIIKASAIPSEVLEETIRIINANSKTV